MAKFVRRGRSVSIWSIIVFGSDLIKSHIELSDDDQTDSFDDINARIKIGNNWKTIN